MISVDRRLNSYKSSNIKKVNPKVDELVKSQRTTFYECFKC